MNQKYNDQLCVLNQVDLNTDMTNNVLSKRVFVKSTEKPRDIGPHNLPERQ